MPPCRAALLTAALLLAPPASASSIEGVEFPATYVAGGDVLALQGVGLLRYRVFFKGYVAALYLGEAVPAEQVLDDVPRRLEIEYFWGIPAEKFADATNAGIAKNVDTATYARLEERIARFNRFYADVEPGDRYTLTYLPGAGTELALNGSPLGSMEGADFAAALFAIWLGEEPFDAGLKSELLGLGS